MSYQVLARKWRPHNFSDLVGQEHVLRALVHGLDTERLHHAYLFTGTRGVGKTTIGRILARCLSCETGVTSTPCGECGSCREILEGRFVDLIEIDAASQTKVEDMRELLDNVQYAPTHGRFKIYLIDEVHMLSSHSFNALLKTLEEPPEHVKFLLATTDPQKLPVTILSRCLQFNLKRLSPERIVGHLQPVLTQEGVDFDESALWLLARAADGSMRDALSLTDQAIAFGGNSLRTADVSQMLGTIDRADVLRLCEALLAGDGGRLLEEIARIDEFAPDYGAILAELLTVFHRVSLEQAVPGSVDNTQGDQEAVRNLAGRLSPEDAQLFYQTALVSRKDLEVTPDARMGFEMALLRMLAFRPGGEGAPPSPSSQSDQAQGGVAKVPAPAAEAPAETEPESPPPTPQSEEPPLPDEPPLPEEPPEQQEPPMPDVPDEMEPEPDRDALAHASAERPASTDTDDAAGTRESAPAAGSGDFDWCRDFHRLNLKGMPANLAANAAWEENDGEITLVLDSGHHQLLHGRHEARIVEAVRDIMGADCRIQFRAGDPAGHTPAAWREARAAERQEQALVAIRQDPVVQSIVERFEGWIREDSIEPLVSGLSGTEQGNQTEVSK